MSSPLRVYADTSVFGGVFDDEFARASQVFFSQVHAGRFKLVTSALVTRELARAPQNVRKFYRESARIAQRVRVTRPILDLRDAYLDAGILGPSSLADALHVAVAAVSGCPILVSWNCRHIVHFQKIPRYNQISRKLGYSDLAIHTPLELIET